MKKVLSWLCEHSNIQGNIPFYHFANIMEVLFLINVQLKPSMNDV